MIELREEKRGVAGALPMIFTSQKWECAAISARVTARRSALAHSTHSRFAVVC